MSDAKPRGRFVWFDLHTTEPALAPGFYTRVTGWETMPWQGAEGYTMWTREGAPLGGVGKLDKNGGQGPHWLGYVSTPNVDETVKQAVNLGARTLKPPTDIPTVGRFAILADPHGAVFAVFTALNETPGHEGEPQLREFSWHELATHDYPAAFRFYERLFGWEKLEAMDMGEGVGVYQMFGRNGVMLGGMFNSAPQMPAPSGVAALRARRRRRPRSRCGEDIRRASAQRADGGTGRRLDRAVHGPAGRDVRSAREEEITSFGPVISSWSR